MAPKPEEKEAAEKPNLINNSDCQKNPDSQFCQNLAEKGKALNATRKANEKDTDLILLINRLMEKSIDLQTKSATGQEIDTSDPDLALLKKFNPSAGFNPFKKAYGFDDYDIGPASRVAEDLKKGRNPSSRSKILDSFDNDASLAAENYVSPSFGKGDQNPAQLTFQPY